MQRCEGLGRCHYRSVTSGDAGDTPGDPGGGARGRARRTRRAPQLPGGVRPPRRRRHVRGTDVGREGPRQGHPHRRGADPRAGPRRGVRRRHGQLDQLQHGLDLDLRACPDVRLPRSLRPRGRVGQAPRPRPPGDRVGRVRRRARRRLRRAELEARRPGDGALQLRRRPGPVRSRRLDAGQQPAHLGLRDELRRLGRPGARQGQPAHAQADAPHVGGGGGQRALQLDDVPHAREPERRRR